MATGMRGHGENVEGDGKWNEVFNLNFFFREKRRLDSCQSFSWNYFSDACKGAWMIHHLLFSLSLSTLAHAIYRHWQRNINPEQRRGGGLVKVWWLCFSCGLSWNASKVALKMTRRSRQCDQNTIRWWVRTTLWFLWWFCIWGEVARR